MVSLSRCELADHHAVGSDDRDSSINQPGPAARQRVETLLLRRPARIAKIGRGHVTDQTAPQTAT